MLFLDEASSALDRSTEKSIMDELRKNANEMTIVVVTHRLGIIDSADTVIEI